MSLTPTAPKRIGRPTLLTPELQARIVALVRIPTFPESAARANGISAPTYYEWMSRGRDHVALCKGDGCTSRDHPYAEFQDAIEKARADAENSLAGIMRQSASGAIYRNHLPNCADPRPGMSTACKCPVVTQGPQPFVAARMLESFARSRWLRDTNVQLTGADGGPIVTVDITAEVIEKARKVRERLMANATIVPPMLLTPVPDADPDGD